MMPAAERKPPVKLMPMESREPHSIRYTPTEWQMICDAARSRSLEPAVFARKLTMYGLSIVQAPIISEASLGITGFGR